MAALRTIRVFEHQVLRVGERVDEVIFGVADFEALVQWVEGRDCPYLKIEHKAVRFRNYVGVIQCNSLCIEILPKLDRWLASTDAIQDCLVQMLKVSRFLKIDTLKSVSISLKALPLIDLFWKFYLEEVAKLLQEGLLRSYRRDQGWKPHLKGKLDLSKQLRHPQLVKGFYTQATTYDYDHPLNAVLYGALLVLRGLPLSPANQILLGQVLNRFPKLTYSTDHIRLLDSMHLDWKMKRYRDALFLAKMILRDNSPDSRAGGHQGVALIFDMNVLFESYIYQLLVRAKPEKARISYQEQRFFWLKRSIRPDIVCQWRDKRIVMDTKWKILPTGQPPMEDLRQMYVYNRYFRAAKGVLLYPRLGLNESITAPFHGVGSSVDHGICEVRFLDLVSNGQLNLDIGKALWSSF
ncbi:MAG: hypothetical protein HRU41_39930 [Saprospiraceae bacterium]|nr:hypothetical protein [Saprospiraceae bacterium]